jgi:ATP-dependent helicase HrpA
MLELNPFADALDEVRDRGIDGRPGWQALRWALEEFRVSLFAQELGAKGGASGAIAMKFAVHRLWDW